MRTLPRMLLTALLVVALVLSLMPAGASAGPDESIRVSGHWVIEVRDPDGTPVARREFHNELATLGPNTLAALMTSANSPGPLSVFISCTSNCCPGSGGGQTAQSCRITEPRAPAAVASRNLTVTRNVGSFELRGSVVLTSNTTISGVSTQVVTCGRTVAPQTCNSLGAGTSLTSTVLSSPMPVVAGQQVLVAVTIGFAIAAAP